MPLSRTQFTVKQLMIVVAIAALLLLPILWLIEINREFSEAYGPDGRYIGDINEWSPSEVKRYRQLSRERRYQP